MRLTPFRGLAALALSAALAGCATAPQNSQQAVFQTKSGYAVALQGAVAYKRLPACATPAVLPCSSPAVVAQLQKADNVAASALDAAESAVRTPSFGTDAQTTAVAAANAAMRAFAALVAQLGVKK